MNMGTDARVRYTKKVIRENLIELLQEKPLKKITVKELCERAEINRATFYKYYLDVYDLFEKIEDDFLEDLNQRIGQSLDSDFQETLILILRSIQEQSQVYLALFSENGDPQFPEKIMMRCYEHSVLPMKTRFQTLTPSEQEWLYYFLAQGLSGVISRWIIGGMKEDVEDVAAFARRLEENVTQNLA